MATKSNKLAITVAGAIPGTLGTGNRRVLAFNVTQTTNGTSASDKYGRFLKHFAAATTADPNNFLAQREVAAWFQEGLLLGSTVGNSNPSMAKVAIDFIAATGVATTLASIDPVTTRNFRVRAIINRVITSDEAGRSTINGTLFVQRSHTIDA